MTHSAATYCEAIKKILRSYLSAIVVSDSEKVQGLGTSNSSIAKV